MGVEGLDGRSGPDVNTSIFPVGSCFTGCSSSVLIGVSEHSNSTPSFIINAVFGPLPLSSEPGQPALAVYQKLFLSTS